MGSGMRKYIQGDKVIWGVIILLSIFSLLAVYSSTGTLAYKKMGGNTTYYLIRHGVILFASLFIIFVFHLIPYQLYSRLSVILLWASAILLVFTLISGTSINQASRWLTLPGLGFTVQPSDFAKVSLIMYLARQLSLNQEKVKHLKEGYSRLLWPVLLITILILPANLSTALILFTVSLILMFIGRVRFVYLLGTLTATLFVIGIFIGVSLFFKHEGRVTTWKNRVENFIQGEDNAGSYQAVQAKIAVATGGLFGKKPGKSTQRNFLPHPYSDFIYAIIIEEYGLIFGAIPILLAYLFLLYRAGLIVRKSDRTFPAFLTMGLTLLIVFQALVNMGVAVNLFPVTGQTLPFVSMGGSSMLFTSIAFGIILSISRTVENQDIVKEEMIIEENDATFESDH
ncbi:MAG: FtsW/RodA/SpoVE family cell cycle protein [Chlorobi bacterium]|nr:FtsW/RodA/SpoVE family cell cycle protein [Chlorobiota bacterium]